MNTFIIACLLIGVVVAQEGGYHHEQGHGHGHEHHEQYIDYQAHPHYRYDYSVHDPKTHDVKRQWESRDGHLVKGEYTLHQPDGRVRTVKYHADKDTGFQAEVEYKGHGVHHYQVQHHEPHKEQHHH